MGAFEIISSFFGAFAAALIGLWIWRVEQIAMRRFQVAEDVMTTLWECADALRAARSRGIFADEGKSRPRANYENDDVARARDTNFVVKERLITHNDKFSRLNSLRAAARYNLGIEAVRAIDAIFEIRWEILGAVDILLQLSAFTMPHIDEDTRRFRAIIFGGGENDTIAPKIDKAEKDLQVICNRQARAASGLFPWRVHRAIE